MASMAGLPKIPGAGFGEELLRTDFRKSQLLNTRTGVSDRKPTGMMPQFDTMKLGNPHIIMDSGAKSKLSLDRKVLRFQGYFKEGVHESAQERERVRKCVVFYYLEDDTIAVSEPKQDNSGIPGQGALIKRHQIPRPFGGMYTFEDLNIGALVTLYGKTFHLIDCDVFTRRFLTGLGIDVPPTEEFPDDQYTSIRRQVNSSMVPRKAKQGDDIDYLGGSRRSRLSPDEIRATQRFLVNDKKVLRFYCMWDDRSSLYGDVRLFTLQYFRADDTIEISETNPPNCGRDPFPSFMKRGKIPKSHGGRFVNPSASLSFKKEQGEYLTDKDLRIGVELNVYGRKMLIYDCDTFTQQYLRETFGITDFTPVKITLPGPPKIPVEPPPHNGFGDEEDSLGSWKHLVLKAPKKDVRKFMENADNMLKFQLRLKGGDPSNAIRKFVLTYFLADDTISIFEPAQRNSGIIGGRFLQRQKVKHVGADGQPTPEYIKPSDLYVGTEITINRHRFVVFSTDERSLTFMERNPEGFPRSDINLILSKLRAMMLAQTGLREAFEAGDTDRSGTLDYEEFGRIVENLQLDISEQELLTVMRFFDRNGDGAISWTEFMATVMPPELQAQYGARAEGRTWQEIEALARREEEDSVDRFQRSR